MAVRKDFVGLHRVGLLDAHEDEVVEDAFGRQREVHDLGEVQPLTPSPSPIRWERVAGRPGGAAPPMEKSSIGGMPTMVAGHVNDE